MAELIPVLVHLRPVTPEDREFLWWLHRETMRGYVDQTWGSDDSGQRRRFDESFDPAQLQMIEYEGRSIGSLSVQRPAHEVFLSSIEVAPAFQKRGVGTHLVRGLIAEADQAKLPIRLSVLKVNPARRLYERLGFERTEETPTHYIMKRYPCA